MINGLTVDLVINYTDPVTSWTYYDLIFSGTIDPSGSGQLNFNQFESGVTGICFTEFSVNSTCHNLIEPSHFYEMDSIMNYTDSLSCNSGGVSIYADNLVYSNEGIYSTSGDFNFLFANFQNTTLILSNEAVLGDLSLQSFSVNNRAVHYLDESFPQTIDGVIVDLYGTYTDPTTLNFYYELSFTGSSSVANYFSVELFQTESTVTSLCLPDCDSTFIDSTASISVHTNSFELNAFPNPAVDFITISASEQLESVSVFDLNGAIVSLIYPVKNTVRVDVSQLKSGMYIYEAKTSKGIQRQRFIKN